VSALADVVSVRGRNGIRHAVIGAAALAIHGVTRSTGDVDLLALDIACFDEPLWRDLSARGYSIDRRRGDATDPLAGVVRIVARSGESIDVIVGRHQWQARVLERAELRRIGDAEVHVVRPPELVLLKLHAGGAQDAWDIDQLMDLDAGLQAEVGARVGDLSRDAALLWKRILERRGG